MTGSPFRLGLLIPVIGTDSRIVNLPEPEPELDRWSGTEEHAVRDVWIAFQYQQQTMLSWIYCQYILFRMTRMAGAHP